MSKTTLSKADLIAAVQAKHPDLTKKQVGEVVDTLLGAISVTIAKGDEVSISGFGKFHTAARASRVGRNPKTGEEIRIAASIAPKFSPGKTLKDAVASK